MPFFFAVYLFDVCVEGNGHVQQNFTLLHAANKILDSVFELVGSLVDLFWVALPCLGQLLSCLKQLVSISVCVLPGRRGDKRQRQINSCRQHDLNKMYFFRARLKGTGA